MKKILAAVMAVIMLCVLTGCAQKQEEPNGIMEAVGTSFNKVDQAGGNSIRVTGEEGRQTVIRVDMSNTSGTLARPFIFAEPGVDFYKIEHSEADFSGVFAYTMNLLAKMQESEEHKAVTEPMDASKLPEGLALSDIGFMNMGYVPDPQKRCEILFTGLTNTGEGTPIRDEVYAFCRFGMMSENRDVTIINVLIADQNDVYAIAQKVHQAGKLPAGVEAWMLRKLGL